jgi:uncharacterized membrane protein
VKMHKYYMIAMVVLVLELAAVLYLGYSLPTDAKIPVHWNIHNQIDGYAARNTAIFPFWLFNLGLFLVLMFSRQISPVFRQNRERYDQIMPLLTLVLVGFFALIHVYMLLLGHYPAIESKVQFIFILMGAMFLLLGNILPKLPRNFIAGIKTPWTFYSDEIWRRTSRVGGYCFVLMGLLMLVMGIGNLRQSWMAVLMVIGLGVVVIVPTLYSFILYQKSKKEE